MTTRNKAARRYFRQVNSWIPCAGKMKRDILARIRDEVAGYLDENPEADDAELRERFGAPQRIAASYVEEMDAAELLNNLRIRRRILRIAAAAALAVVFMWGVVVTVALIESSNTFNGYYVDKVYEGNEIPVEEGK